MDQVVQSVNELRRRHLERKSQAKQVYKTILTDVLKHIQMRDNQNRSNTVYRVPFIVYGNPAYDITKATYHIMKQLTRAGYVVFPHENNHLYIDWSVLCETKNSNRVRFNVASIDSK
jgi:hypothetical protein